MHPVVLTTSVAVVVLLELLLELCPLFPAPSLLEQQLFLLQFQLLRSNFCCISETSLNRVCLLVFAYAPCILIFTSLSHIWVVLALQCLWEPIYQHLFPGFFFFDSLTKLNHIGMATVQDSHMHSSLHTATSAVQFRLFKGFCSCCWVTGLKFDCEFFFGDCLPFLCYPPHAMQFTHAVFWNKVLSSGKITRLQVLLWSSLLRWR